MNSPLTALRPPPQLLPDQPPPSAAAPTRRGSPPPAGPLGSATSLASLSSHGSGGLLPAGRHGAGPAQWVWVGLCATCVAMAEVPAPLALAGFGVPALIGTMAVAALLLYACRRHEERRAVRELLGAPPG